MQTDNTIKIDEITFFLPFGPYIPFVLFVPFGFVDEKKLNDERFHLAIEKIRSNPVGFIYGYLKNPKGLTTVKNILQVLTMFLIIMTD